MYAEFYEYRDDRGSGEEYELIENWAKDLKLEKYFELVDEEIFGKEKSLDDIIDEIEKDPFDLESRDPRKEKEMEDFQKSQKEMGTNMAVVMYMVEALEFFKICQSKRSKKLHMRLLCKGLRDIDQKTKIISLD